MSDGAQPEIAFGDPLTATFWAAAREHRLVLQRCADCGAHQFYPRPYCIGCQSDEVAWTNAVGTGVVYSLTTVHLDASPVFSPPFRVALADLDEGPRLLGYLIDDAVGIGDRVRVGWVDREGGPPLLTFIAERGGQ